MGALDMFFLLVLCLFTCSYSHLKIKTNKLKNNPHLNLSKDEIKNEENFRQINNTNGNSFIKNLIINFKENVDEILNENYETEHSIEAKAFNHLLSYIF